MRFKHQINLRQLSDYLFVVESSTIENKIITCNAVAAFLIENLKDVEFELETISNLMQHKYGISKETSETDAKDIVLQWKQNDLV